MINTFSLGKNELILLPKSSDWIRLPEPKEAELMAISKLFKPSWLEEQNIISNTATGRGLVYFFKAMNENCVLRHYYRGGLVAKVSNDKFIFHKVESTRPFRELNLLAHLHSAGLNVAKPIAAKINIHGLIYSADIITAAIENAHELHEHLLQQPFAEAGWRELGAALKKMHNLQACHFDINVKNILLQTSKNTPVNQQSPEPLEGNEAEIKIYLLDFDGCKLRSGESWKSANLNRFKRSLEKQKAKHSPYHYDQSCWRWVEAGYSNA